MLEPDSFPDLGLTKEPSINKSIKNDNTNANRSNLNSTQNDLSNSVKRTKFIKRSETS